MEPSGGTIYVRVWQYPKRTDVWLGAAAEDIGFRFKQTHWTHSTDPDIDSERAKVVNDLAFVGCVNATRLLSRNSVDLVLNDYIDPNLMAGVAEPSAVRQRGSHADRLPRKTEPANSRARLVNGAPHELDWLTPVAPH